MTGLPILVKTRTEKRKEPPPRSPTEPATSPREESPSPGEDQEEATQPKPNPSEGTSPPEDSVSPRHTVEVNIGDPHPDPVIPGANQEPQPEEAEKQSAAQGRIQGQRRKKPAQSWWQPLVAATHLAHGPLQGKP